MDNMPIFITGGSGFVGSEVCRLLTEEKIHHTIFDRLSPRFSSIYTSYIKGDIRDSELLSSSLKGFKSIIHLAAEWNDIGVSEHEYITTNINGTQNVVNAATANNIKFIIFTSSSSVYKFKYNNKKIFYEKDLSLRPTTLYGQTKRAGEKILEDWFVDSSDKFLKIIRPSVIYGPYNRGNVYNLIRQVISKNFIFPNRFDVIKSISYVENIANFILYLFKHNVKEHVFNYADNPQMTTYELVRTIRTIYNNDSKLHTINSKLLLFISYIIDILGRNIRNKYGSMKVKKFLCNTHMSNELVFNTGYKQLVSTEKGLKKTIEWIKNNE